MTWLAPLAGWPLPAPIWILKSLLIATFVVHLVFMNLTVGGTLLEAVFLVKGKPKHLDVAGGLAALMPYTLAMTISFGVAPLLFVQVLYGNLFYTTAIVMGVPFILVIPVLITAYTLLYVQAAFWDSLGRARAWIALLIFGLLGYIGFVWVNLFSLMAEPERLPGKFAAHPGGWQLDLVDPTVLPRAIHMVFGIIALAGLYVAILGVRRLKLEPEQGRWQYRSGATWFSGATLVNLVIGGWWFMALPGHVRKALMGGNLFATIAFGVGLLSALVALVCALLGINSLKPAAYLYTAAGALLLTFAAMAVTRDGVRDAMLKPLYSPWNQPVSSQWIAVGLFLLLFAFGAWAVIWLLRRLGEGARGKPKGVMGPGLTDSGLHKVAPQDSGGVRRKPPSSGAHRLDDN